MKKIKITVSLLLALTMLFSCLSVAVSAVDVAPTTAPLTTTAPDEDEKSDDYWDGYYDGYDDGYSDAESEDYESGYDDGYYDGERDGYEDGYYEGYYDGVNAFKVPSIFERVEDFFDEFIYRIEDFFYRIQDFFERLFKVGDYAPSTPVDPEADFIPDGTQPTLYGDEEAAALCEEFNDLIEDFCDIDEAVAITKKVDVDLEVKDLPAAVQSITDEIIEQFVIDASTTNEYEAGDYAYEVQPTWLYPAGLTSAEKTVNADGTTDYRFVVVAEAAYFDGHETTGVKYVDGEFYYGVDLQHDYVADTLYIEAADLGPVVIKSAEIYYPGATITAKTDAQGRLIAYDVNMPVSGTGEAKVAMINVTANVSGYRNEGFVMVYAD